MSSGSSDSESISECEFDTTSESIYDNNEPEYLQEKIDKMKQKNGSVFWKGSFQRRWY